MFFTLWVFIQSASSSGNTLSAISIAFGSLMDCISCSGVLLKTYFTGCSDTCQLEMCRITLDNQFTSVPWYWGLQHFFKEFDSCKAAPGRQTKSVASLEQLWWIALQCLTAHRMKGKLWWKQPLMKWWWAQCGQYVNSLYLSANKITLIYPSQR